MSFSENIILFSSHLAAEEKAGKELLLRINVHWWKNKSFYINEPFVETSILELLFMEIHEIFLFVNLLIIVLALHQD